MLCAGKIHHHDMISSFDFYAVSPDSNFHIQLSANHGCGNCNTVLFFVLCWTEETFHATETEKLCFSPSTKTSCGKESEGQDAYLGPLFILFISQFIVGISMSIFYSVGISFIDDNINKKTTSFYYCKFQVCINAFMM